MKHLLLALFITIFTSLCLYSCGTDDEAITAIQECDTTIIVNGPDLDTNVYVQGYINHSSYSYDTVMYVSAQDFVFVRGQQFVRLKFSEELQEKTYTERDNSQVCLAIPNQGHIISFCSSVYPSNICSITIANLTDSTMSGYFTAGIYAPNFRDDTIRPDSTFFVTGVFQNVPLLK